MNECNRWHFAHVGAPWKYSKCSRQSWYDMTWWTLHKCVAKELLVMAWALPPQTRFKGESVASELFKFLLDTVWMSRWCFTDLVEEASGNVSVSRLWYWSVKVQPGANHAVWWYTSILCIHASTITPQVALWCLSLHLLEKWPQIWILVLAWESASGNCILQVTSKSPKSLLSMPLIASADKPVKLTTSWYAKAGSQVRLFKWQLQTSECNRLYCAHAGESCRWVRGSLMHFDRMSCWRFAHLSDEAHCNLSASRIESWLVQAQPGANYVVSWYSSILPKHWSMEMPNLSNGHGELNCTSMNLLWKVADMACCVASLNILRQNMPVLVMMEPSSHLAWTSESYMLRSWIIILTM